MPIEINKKLKDEFRDELYQLYKETCTAVNNYIPTTFWVALGQPNWLDVIKRFIKDSDSAGIKKLIKVKRSDLSFEHVIIHNEKYHELFTKEELEICKQTLDFMEMCIKEGKEID